MPEIYNEPSDGEQVYQKTYEDNRWDRSEVLQPQIDVEDVLATQALVMRLLNLQPRSVLRRDKVHGFSLLNNVKSRRNESYDGSLEEYLACRVAKTDHDQWKMRIRFRQNELSEEESDKSYIDDFGFDWLRDGNLQAWYGNYLTHTTPEGTYESWRDIRPIAPDMVSALHDRLKLHTDQGMGATALHRSREMNGEV